MSAMAWLTTPEIQTLKKCNGLNFCRFAGRNPPPGKGRFEPSTGNIGLVNEEDNDAFTPAKL